MSPEGGWAKRSSPKLVGANLREYPAKPRRTLFLLLDAPPRPCLTRWSPARPARTFCFSCSTVSFTWWSSLHVAQQAAAWTAFSAFSSCPEGGDGLESACKAAGIQTPGDHVRKGGPGGLADAKIRKGWRLALLYLSGCRRHAWLTGSAEGTPTLWAQLFPLSHPSTFLSHV